jgi:hypothetical protein
MSKKFLVLIFISVIFSAVSQHAATAQHVQNSLSDKEIETAIARIRSKWKLPSRAKDAIQVRIKLDRDGRFSEKPEVISSGNGKLWERTRASALRALEDSQPFDMFSKEKYDDWSYIEFVLDPIRPKNKK